MKPPTSYQIDTWTRYVTGGMKIKKAHGCNLGSLTMTELIDAASDECRTLASIIGRAGDKWSVLIVVLLGAAIWSLGESLKSVSMRPAE